MFLCSSNFRHHLAAARNGRYALSTIALTDRGTLSTDGHCLLFVPYPVIDPKEAPDIDGVDAASPPPKGDPFLVSTDDAEKAAAMVGKPRRHAPAATRVLQAHVEGESLVVGATDLAHSRVLRLQRAQGQFPEVGRVIPDYRSSVAITMNVANLIQTLKAMAGASSEPTVTLRVIDDQQAMGLSCRDGVAALIMPIAVDSPAEHVPCQLEKLREGPGTVTAPAPEEPEEPAEPREDWHPVETEMQAPAPRRSRKQVVSR